MQKIFSRLFVLPILLLLASCSMQKTSIQKIDSFERAQSILAAADGNTLVIFDVDDTLITPVDTLLQTWFLESAQGKQLYKQLNEYAATKDNPREYLETILEKIKFAAKFRLIEEQVAQVIKELQERGVKVIALTHWPTGAGKIMLSWQARRFEQLAGVGIDFSSSFEAQEIALDALIKSDKKPLFYKGILLTDDVEKGIVLGAFLDAMHYKPTKIIFFDDSEKLVESVKNEAGRRGISYHGFIYKAAEKLSHQYDLDIIKLQHRHLIEHDEYMAEEQAHQLLKK